MKNEEEIFMRVDTPGSPVDSRTAATNGVQRPIEIVFGACAEPLAKQLGVGGALVKRYQADADAITRLAVRGFLTDGERHRARQRLMKRIALNVKRRKRT